MPEHRDSGADDGRGCRAHRRGEHCESCAGGHSQGFASLKAQPPEYVTCPNCGCAARVGLHGGGSCQQCFTPFRVSCSRCGQLGAVAYGVCGSCQTADREPQGESMRLFTPAPTQLPGQLSM